MNGNMWITAASQLHCTKAMGLTVIITFAASMM